MTMIVDVAIGVFLLYLALALIVTTLQELLSSLFATRAHHLYRVLSSVVRGRVLGSADDKALIQLVYEHPLIRSLADRVPQFRDGKPRLLGRGLPSYIPSRAFVLALLDVLRSGGGAPERA